MVGDIKQRLKESNLNVVFLLANSWNLHPIIVGKTMAYDEWFIANINENWMQTMIYLLSIVCKVFQTKDSRRATRIYILVWKNRRGKPCRNIGATNYYKIKARSSIQLIQYLYNMSWRRRCICRGILEFFEISEQKSLNKDYELTKKQTSIKNDLKIN